MRNILVVLSGPSGVGKGTMKERLMQRGEFVFSVSCTTREPRPGEREGVDYFFLTREEFERRIGEDFFLEYDEHFGFYYGTPRGFVEAKLKESSVLLDLDVVGALNLRKNFPSAILVFLAPPDPAALKARLEARGAEDAKQIEGRLARADFELSKQGEFDYVIVNDDRDRAEAELKAIVTKEENRE